MTTPTDPEELTAAGAPVHGVLPEDTAPGSVWLTVSDLDRSLEWYSWAFGMRGRKDGARATLAVGGRDLLVLCEEPGAPPSRGFSGLYHFALAVPQRADLARWFAHASRERLPLTGTADHFVSEALYLDDPDEHGIEIYWDRPRSAWEGQVSRRMGTFPLDTMGLMREARGGAYRGLPVGTRMGHVHLQVSELSSTVRFYRDVLGLGLMASFGRQAAFLSAGGYHHHLGVNTWESAGEGQPPPGTATMKRWTLVVPSDQARDLLAERVLATGQEPQPMEEDGFMVWDPSGNPVAVTAPG